MARSPAWLGEYLVDTSKKGLAQIAPIPVQYLNLALASIGVIVPPEFKEKGVYLHRPGGKNGTGLASLVLGRDDSAQAPTADIQQDRTISPRVNAFLHSIFRVRPFADELHARATSQNAICSALFEFFMHPGPNPPAESVIERLNWLNHDVDAHRTLSFPLSNLQSRNPEIINKVFGLSFCRTGKDATKSAQSRYLVSVPDTHARTLDAAVKSALTYCKLGNTQKEYTLIQVPAALAVEIQRCRKCLPSMMTLDLDTVFECNEKFRYCLDSVYCFDSSSLKWRAIIVKLHPATDGGQQDIDLIEWDSKNQEQTTRHLALSKAFNMVKSAGSCMAFYSRKIDAEIEEQQYRAASSICVNSASANAIISNVSELVRVGQRTQAQYQNGRWYSCTIEQKLDGDKFLVTWDDNDTSDRIKTFEQLAAGYAARNKYEGDQKRKTASTGKNEPARKTLILSEGIDVCHNTYTVLNHEYTFTVSSVHDKLIILFFFRYVYNNVREMEHVLLSWTGGCI